MESVNHKASALSHRRASKSVEDNDAMFEKFAALFKSHHENGILKTTYPHPSQVKTILSPAPMCMVLYTSPLSLPPFSLSPHLAPSPTHQFYGGDEIGFDPQGKYYKVIRLKEFAGIQGRAFRLQRGEHAPFWVTVFFWSR